MPLPPLILIHGYPFDHTMWNPVVAALKSKTKIITPDLPGFGSQPVLTGDPSLDLTADDLAKIFELHGIRQAVVAGMSLGGYVALALAERHSERVAGLGLISTQTAADSDEGKQARRTLIEKVRREGTKPAVDALLPKLFAAANQSKAELNRIALDGAERAGVDGMCWALEAMARRPDRTEIAKKLGVPTLILHGAEDKIIPPDRARQLSQIIPGANYIELPGVGHASPLESPKAVADALLDLLARSEKALHHTPKRDERADSLPGIVWSPTERGL